MEGWGTGDLVIQSFGVSWGQTDLGGNLDSAGVCLGVVPVALGEWGPRLSPLENRAVRSQRHPLRCKQRLALESHPSLAGVASRGAWLRGLQLHLTESDLWPLAHRRHILLGKPERSEASGLLTCGARWASLKSRGRCSPRASELFCPPRWVPSMPPPLIERPRPDQAAPDTGRGEKARTLS